jgi:hypothetical protein
MNFRKDIYLILGALLVLTLGGLAWWVLDQGGLPSLVKPLLPSEEIRAKPLNELTIPAQGAEYPASPKTPLTKDLNDWSSLKEDEDGWDFDLFTTIDIDWKTKDAEYIPSSQKDIPIPPFGVTLVKVGHPFYPYLLRGTMAARSKQEADREFTIENVNTHEYYERCKLGKPFGPNLAITPVSFVKGVLTVKDNSPDLKGRLIPLDEVKPLEFTDTIDVALVASEDASITWTFHAVGDKFEYQNARFVIKEIDLDNKTVTVEKTFKPNPKKPEKSFVEILSVPAPAAAKTAKDKDAAKPTAPVTDAVPADKNKPSPKK